MNQKLWSGLSTAALILTTLGNSASSYASELSISDEISDPYVPQENLNSEQVASTSPSTDVISPESSQENLNLNQAAPTSPSTDTLTAPAVAPANEVAKVGEYQSQEEIEEEEEAIAIIQPHSLDNRQAATLYVRSIPVLTFIDSTASNLAEPNETADLDSAADADVKIGSTQDSDTSQAPTAYQTDHLDDLSNTVNQASTSDAVQRATAIAAQINQMHLNSVDAETINVRWDTDRERYIIVVNGEELVEMNAGTILPDSTRDPAQDALQATNRLRRLVGDAPPLRDIEGRPQPVAPQISLGAVQAQLRGIASWYGPGFHGNRSASGEVFNQNALTAAHRHLPFGTQVRVTNLNTGLSVIVRITDRGPFTGGRVIDLSAGAARVIGLISSGVAPVRLDVMGSARTASSSN